MDLVMTDDLTAHVDHMQQIAAVQMRQTHGGWYRISNAADTRRADVFVYEEIGGFGVRPAELVNEIAGLDVDEIVVAISSGGGSAFDGVTIYNALRQHPARITTRIDGLAASAASVVAQAGDVRLIVPTAQMMIHQAHGVCVGDAAIMREFADLLDRMSDTIAGLYAERSGRPADEFKALMAAGEAKRTWFDADEAVEAGLVDAVDRVSSAQDAQNVTDATRTVTNDVTVEASVPTPVDWVAVFEEAMTSARKEL